jgi:hypothetical protein
LYAGIGGSVFSFSIINPLENLHSYFDHIAIAGGVVYAITSIKIGNYELK